MADLRQTLMASNEVNHWDDGCHNRLQEYTEEYGIPFIDFNTAEYRNAAGLVISEDVAADLRHMNIDGAYKATDYLGRISAGSLRKCPAAVAGSGAGYIRLWKDTTELWKGIIEVWMNSSVQTDQLLQRKLYKNV